MPNKPRKRRRLTGGFITHLSFVDRGANQVRPILKAEKDGCVEITAKVASFDKKEGLLYALVYGPEETGFVDAHGDSAPGAVVKHFCHNFFRPGGGHVDEQHSFVDIEGAHVAENLIVQPGDRRFDGMEDYDGNPVDPAGWWGVVMKIEDQALQARCDNGDIAGISMFGEEVWMRNLAVKSFANALADRLGDTNKEFTDMDEAKLAELFGNAVAPIAKEIKDLKATLAPVEKAETPTEPKEEKAPVIKFEGDPSKPEDVASHKEKLFKASCDFNTIEGVEKWEKYLTAKKAAEKPADEDKGEKSEAVKKAEADAKEANRKLAEIRKQSTQQGPDQVDPNESAADRKARISKAAREIGKNYTKELGR